MELEEAVSNKMVVKVTKEGRLVYSDMKEVCEEL